jgi:hypothetical protein
MLSRLVLATVVVILVSRPSAIGADRDHLRHGEAQPTTDYEIRYARAIRLVLARAWRKDVVLRTLDLPPFNPEVVSGLARDSRGYRAFITGASTKISDAVPRRHHSKIRDWRTLKRPVYERPISNSLAARIAALWRRVLRDERNYGKDSNFYIDTSHFTFYLAFAPGEKITAWIEGWGPHVEQLLRVEEALAVYADGTTTEQKLAAAVAKAERKLGI